MASSNHAQESSSQQKPNVGIQKTEKLGQAPSTAGPGKEGDVSDTLQLSMHHRERWLESCLISACQRVNR